MPIVRQDVVRLDSGHRLYMRQPGSLGLEGAVSRQLGVFMEAGYGFGLTGPDEQTNRLVARVGMRLKF